MRPSAASAPSRKRLAKHSSPDFVLMRTAGWSRVVPISNRAFAPISSSRIYLFVIPPQINRIRIPVHSFIALLPVHSLRKIKELAASQFTTLFHNYTGCTAGISRGTTFSLKRGFLRSSAGMELANARYAALRQFGNQTLLREVSREMWGVRLIDAFFRTSASAYECCSSTKASRLWQSFH